MRSLNHSQNYLNFATISLGIFFVFYEILSSIFAYLPILYGLFFCYMFLLFEEKEHFLQSFDFRWYFSLAFLLFIDITHNFFVFSSWLAFLIFYFACADWIKINLKIGKLTPVIFVICAYACIFILDWTLSYIDDTELKHLDFRSLIPIAFESLIAFIFFKDRI